MYVYLNGEVKRAEEAHVSVLDHGFLYGAGLFETMRTVAGRPMLWAAHSRRLRESAAELGFLIPWSDEELEQGMIATVQANGLSEAYLRLTVSRGNGALGPSGRSCAEPTLVIYAKELALPTVSVFEKGRDLLILQTVRSTPETMVRVKSLNYLNSLLAYRELELRGGAEGIQLTASGQVAEGAVSNLFFVVDGELWTPAVETGILPGVTRAWAMEEARSQGVMVREKCFTLADVALAEEAFTSNSVAGILPAVSIESKPIGTGQPGPLTQTLIRAWNRLTKI